MIFMEFDLVRFSLFPDKTAHNAFAERTPTGGEETFQIKSRPRHKLNRKRGVGYHRDRQRELEREREWGSWGKERGGWSLLHKEKRVAKRTSDRGTSNNNNDPIRRRTAPKAWHDIDQKGPP